MPQKRTTPLPTIDTTDETCGSRLAFIRKSKGYTQKQLAAKIGISQALLSSYEVGRLALSADMVKRIALTLEATADEILGLEHSKAKSLNTTLARRFRKIENLPTSQRRVLIKTIDIFLKGAQQTNN